MMAAAQAAGKKIVFTSSIAALGVQVRPAKGRGNILQQLGGWQ